MKVIPFIFMALRNTERKYILIREKREENAEWNFENTFLFQYNRRIRLAG